ncbi:MAG: hypothetical protein ACRDRZ_03055 [Pseudonocardiaceae bacterium]
MEPARPLLAALRGHYGDVDGHRDEDAHATFAELTGPGSSRRADYVAVSLWPSRGLTIDAHELKVSRSDWLRELRQPSKAQAWWPHCHRWWLVAGHESIVGQGELPDGWGLMVPGRGHRMKIVLPAPRREITLSMPLLVTLLGSGRRGHTAAVRTARAEAFRHGRQQAQQTVDRARLSPEQKDRLAELERLETLLGGCLGDWVQGKDADTVAAALRLAGSLRKLPGRWQLDQAERTTSEALARVRELRELLAGLATEHAS